MKVTQLTYQPKIRIIQDRNAIYGRINARDIALKSFLIKLTQVIISTGFGTLEHASLKFGCQHCEEALNSVNSCSEDIEMVYGHWLSAHTDLPKALPFQFYVTQFVACYFCGITGTFHEVLIHQKEAHPSNAPTIANHLNRDQCALCKQTAGLEEHFEEAHRSILSDGIRSPFCLTDAILEETLSIAIHKKVECGHCSMEFETNEEFNYHHTTEHPSLKIIGVEKHSSSNWRYECCDLLFSQDEYLMHLEQHSIQLNCGECEYPTESLAELAHHDKGAHDSTNDRCNAFMKHLRKIHILNKAVVDNGLVMSHFALKGTKHDESAKFEEAFSTIAKRLKRQIDTMERYKDDDSKNEMDVVRNLDCDQGKRLHQSKGKMDRKRKRGDTVEIEKKSIAKSKHEHRLKSKMVTTSEGRSKTYKSGVKKVKKQLNLISSKDEDTESDTDSDSDTFSMSSELSSISNISLPSSISSAMPAMPPSRSMLRAELRKQNELVNNLVISGIPQGRHENLLKIFDRLCVKIHAPVSQKDVLKIFRIVGRSEPLIIVKFRTWTAKANVKRSFKYKNLWSFDIVPTPSHAHSSKIFINAHTTRFYGKLVQIAKYYKKAGIIQSFYLCEHGLLVKSFCCEKDYTILSKEELMDWVRKIKDRRFQGKYNKRSARVDDGFAERKSKRPRF